jgi:hypothetical protein
MRGQQTKGLHLRISFENVKPAHTKLSVHFRVAGVLAPDCRGLVGTRTATNILTFVGMCDFRRTYNEDSMSVPTDRDERPVAFVRSPDDLLCDSIQQALSIGMTQGECWTQHSRIERWCLEFGFATPPVQKLQTQMIIMTQTVNLSSS